MKVRSHSVYMSQFSEHQPEIFGQQLKSNEVCCRAAGLKMETILTVVRNESALNSSFDGAAYVVLAIEFIL
jgi:hypothetical protein